MPSDKNLQIYSQRKTSSRIAMGFPLGATSSGAEKCISFPHLYSFAETFSDQVCCWVDIAQLYMENHAAYGYSITEVPFHFKVKCYCLILFSFSKPCHLLAKRSKTSVFEQLSLPRFSKWKSNQYFTFELDRTLHQQLYCFAALTMMRPRKGAIAQVDKSPT